MSEGIPYADIIILALIAGFILLRLRSILGARRDDENLRGYFSRPLPPASDPAPIVQVDEKSLKPKAKDEADPYMATLAEGPVASALADIKAKDPQFSAARFLLGARAAFEMVFDAFVKGDKQALKMLMSDATFQHFSGELDRRTAETNKMETTLVSVQAKDITQASLNQNIARLTVRFESEQVTLVRDAGGKIIEGDPSELHHVEDHWVFERDITSKNPNWKIVET